MTMASVLPKKRKERDGEDSASDSSIQPQQKKQRLTIPRIVIDPQIPAQSWIKEGESTEQHQHESERIETQPAYCRQDKPAQADVK
jgi:hypothetical protein